MHNSLSNQKENMYRICTKEMRKKNKTSPLNYQLNVKEGNIRGNEEEKNVRNTEDK